MRLKFVCFRNLSEMFYFENVSLKIPNGQNEWEEGTNF